MNFTVTSNGDGGDSAPGNGICAATTGGCTLRAAIEENNALGGGGTISVPALTIASQTVLIVSKPVTINGAGPGSTVLDGGSPNPAVKSSRGFYFTPYSGSHFLSGLTIRNMRVTQATDPITEPLRTGNGAAILNEATLTVDNVSITNNQADRGGGIYNMYDFIGGNNNLIVPTLVLNSVAINGNSINPGDITHAGGGLFNGGALTATNLTLTNNSAPNAGGFYNNNPHNRGVAYGVTLTGFVISGNVVAGEAAGIDNDLGTIALHNGVVSGNVAVVSAGGIYNNFAQVGTRTHMTLTNVTVGNNAVTGEGGIGGGIVNIETMTLNSVSIVHNSANYGAGVHNGSPYGTTNSLLLTNTTVSGNQGVTFGIRQARGGGVFNSYNGVLVANNSTIAMNSAVAGGGLDNQVNVLPGNAMTLRNTIVAGNSAAPGWGPDCQGTFASGNYNLIGNTTQCGFAPQSGDRTNIAPLLAPLGDNGGGMPTHALLANSPALNAGNPLAPGSTASACAVTDQRGVSRPQGPRCDIGAFEAAMPRLYLPLVRR